MTEELLHSAGFTDETYHTFLRSRLVQHIEKHGDPTQITEVGAFPGTTLKAMGDLSKAKLEAMNESMTTEAYEHPPLGDVVGRDVAILCEAIILAREAEFVHINTRMDTMDIYGMLMRVDRENVAARTIIISDAHDPAMRAGLKKFALVKGRRWRIEWCDDVYTGAVVLTRISKSALNIITPAGIGDIVWAFQKLQDYDNISIGIACSEPPRSAQFVKMLPGVTHSYMSDIHTDTVIANSISGTSDISLYQDTTFCFQANTWLESGRQIEGFMPKEPVRYTWDFRLSEDVKRQARTIFENVEYPVGFYTSSELTNKEWHGYSARKWGELLMGLRSQKPKTTFVIIGAPYDKDITDYLLHLCRGEHIQHIDMTCKPLELVIESMKYFEALLSFPSGIGILGSVQRTPTVMLMPKHLRKMHNTWVDPNLLESKRFFNIQLADRGNIIPTFTKELNHGKVTSSD